MAKKKKWYVVWEGKQPGIYTSWSECQRQVKGHTGAKFKSFESLSEAEVAFSSAAPVYPKKGQKKSLAQKHGWRYAENPPIVPSVSVDAACSGNPGLLEYRAVDTETEAEFIRRGPFKQGTNNIGEFLALVLALIYLKKREITFPLYTDSRTAISWLKHKKAKTKLVETAHNANLFEDISIAEKWLKENAYETEVLKWDTKNWGEIPADFGRK